MKRIYSILTLAVASLSFIACSDDDNAGAQYLRESAVKVVSSNVTFAAKADTGSVVFEAPAGATVHMDATWATATLDGNRVKVAVNANPRLDGRSAVMTIKSGGDSANVTVQQQGMHFVYGGEAAYAYDDKARTLDIPVTSEGGELSITSPDWVKASIDETGIKLDLAENTTGHMRAGYVYYTAGPYQDSILVQQAELRDIVNRDYILVAADLAQIQPTTQSIEELLVQVPVRLIYDEATKALSLRFVAEKLILPMTIDETTLTTTIRGGAYMGKVYRRYLAYSAIVDYNWYNTFAEAKQPTYASLMSSPDLTLNGQWRYSERLGNVSESVVAKTNDNWFAQIFENAGAYDGRILGILAFNKELTSWVTPEGQLNTTQMSYYAGAPNLYLQPTLVERLPGASGAKANVISLLGGHAEGNLQQVCAKVLADAKKFTQKAQLRLRK